MGRHTVTVKELNDWINKDGWSRFAGSFNKESNKTLEVSILRQFRVTDRGVIKYFGDSDVAAIDAYNAVP